MRDSGSPFYGPVRMSVCHRHFSDDEVDTEVYHHGGRLVSGVAAI